MEEREWKKMNLEWERKRKEAEEEKQRRKQQAKEERNHRYLYYTSYIKIVVSP